MGSRSLIFVFCLQILCFKAVAQEEGFTGGPLGGVATDSDSKWGASFFSLSSVMHKQIQDGAASISNYAYVGANYKLSPDERINIRPAFTVATAGYDQYGVYQKLETKIADLYLNYANYKLALLPGEWGLSGQFRIYFPTSESMQSKRTIAYLHSWMIAEKIFRHGWGVRYNFRPTYYIQSQKAYRNEYDRVNSDGSTSTFIESGANLIGKLDHYVTVGKYLNEIFTPQVEMGFIHQWSYTSDQVNRGSASRNQLKIAPGTEIHVNRSLWFILAAESAVDLNDTRSNFKDGTLRWDDNRGNHIDLFRPENTQFLLFTFWSFL